MVIWASITHIERHELLYERNQESEERDEKM